MFEELNKKFEKKETDLNELRKEKGFSRYILIRSLGNEHLKELIKKFTGEEVNKGGASVFYEKLYYSKASIDDIITYINRKYPEVRDARIKQEEYLPKIIEEFDEVKCGVRNDNLNDTAKDLVRDKSIQSKADLEKKVDDLYENTIRGYILWQYYNQVTNDLIEHLFNDHKNVIPTLRKIKYVDFLVRKGEEIIPFDLKITHISDDYFDLHKKGLTATSTGPDSYTVGTGKSEIEEIKAYYRSVKSDLNLPNYSGLSKGEMLENLKSTGNRASLAFVETCIQSRREMVAEIEKNLIPVEWWNYKYQGERLFKNNNRFFVFLAYRNSFEDARPLKGKIDEISEKVNKKLDAILEKELNSINYYYEKDIGLKGAYEISSTSVLVTD